MDLQTRLQHLDNSLMDFNANDRVSWQLAKIYNTLVAEAQKEYGTDAVVAGLEPVEQVMSGTTNEVVGTLRAGIAQILAVIEGS